jgi:hypothetical protein
MNGMTQCEMRCPSCGSTAQVELDWAPDGTGPHADVRRYDCPNGCQVDEATIRNIVGAQ